MKRFYLYSLILFTTFSFRTKSQEASWILKNSKEGVTVYTRNSASGRKELKVITSVSNVSLTRLVSFLSDKANYKNWVYGCQESYVLKTVSEFEAYHYQRTSPPWPMSDRDLIIHSVITQDPVTKVVTIVATGIPDYLNEKAGVIRVPKFSSYWKIVRVKPEEYEMEHFVSLDPGGDVPNWILNMAVSEGPLKSIKKIKESLPSYTNNITPSIHD